MTSSKDLVSAFIDRCEAECCAAFAAIDKTEAVTLERVLDGFHECNVGQRHFAATSGYGYDDIGRDTLDRLFAIALEAECALVRPHIVSGTHAAFLALTGVLSAGDTMLSITGKPYDTLEKAIGIGSSVRGSLTANGVKYEQIDLTADGDIDIDALQNRLKNGPAPKILYIQRSRGYAWRDSLLPEAMAEAVNAGHTVGALTVVDNCYGEFTGEHEPCHYDADVVFGSLIKNPGGGIAPTGGYIAGKTEWVNAVAEKLTVPGIGGEVGSYAGGYQPFYQGLFMAPSVTAASLKTAVLFASVFSALGYAVLPNATAVRSDIVESVRLGSEEALKAFCKGIQAAAPVDSSAAPEPWDMPGYAHQVIMAAGSFVQGASIELSADAPMIPPYTVYVQGALTYQHGKLGAEYALSELIDGGFVDISALEA